MASPIKGYWQTPTHRTWSTMLQRCRDTNSTNYTRYGARGITVCERWLKFENFLADMGERPNGMSLDRINNDGNYEPGNCRWATPKEQHRNRSDNKIITFDGITASVAELAELHGQPVRRVYRRLSDGWPIKRALGR